MRYFIIIATMTLMAAGVSAQAPLANFGDTPWSSGANEHPVISWQEASFGAGEMVILSSVYDSEGDLVESRIIPLVRADNGYVPLDELGFGMVSSVERKAWRGFDEHGSEGIAPFAENPPSSEDYCAAIKSVSASPNLNIRYSEGVRSINLAYIEGGETKLVAHTEIELR
ncbi:MAG: hypothetical protein ACP5G4_10355, partial [bacterium]